MASEQTLLGLIAGRDPDAAAGFFDAHAPGVRRYSKWVAPPERIDEATLAAFVDFLGRVAAAPPGADLEDLLRKATRSAAASRAEVTGAREPECHAMPELLAATINEELVRDDAPLRAHLKRCGHCRQTAERLAQADGAWITSAGEAAPPEHVRSAWLELMGSEPSAPEVTPASEAEDAAEPEPAPAVEPELPADPEPAPAAEPAPAPRRDGSDVSALYGQKDQPRQHEPWTPAWEPSPASPPNLPPSPSPSPSRRPPLPSLSTDRGCPSRN